MGRKNHRKYCLKVEAKPEDTSKVLSRTHQDVSSPSNIHIFNNAKKSSQAVLSSASTKNSSGHPKAMDLSSLDLSSLVTLDKLIGRVVDQYSFSLYAECRYKINEYRKNLKANNTVENYEDFENILLSKKLDSNFKKCSGVVRKMRQYNDTQKPSLENDIKSLNLSKYLSEIASALSEAKIKTSDIQDVVAICSSIHQRYRDFASLLLEAYSKSLASQKIDLNSSTLPKFSVDLKLFGELLICGVMPCSAGINQISSCIRRLINERDMSVTLGLVTSFCRIVGDELLQRVPTNVKEIADELQLPLEFELGIDADKAAPLSKVLEEYFDVTAKNLKKMHEEMLQSQLHNRRLMRTRGEIPEDRKEAHTEILARYEKYLANAGKLSNSLGLKLPKLKELPAVQEDEDDNVVLLDDSGESSSIANLLIFEDEETRQFYQEYPDLKVYLPPVAYRDNVQQAAQKTKEIEEREKEVGNVDLDLEAAEIQVDEATLDDAMEGITGSDATTDEILPSMRTDAEEEKELELSIKPSFQGYLCNLLNCVNKAMIDKAAIEFAESYNNKQNRKKLVRTLFHIPRQRVDLLPLWSRLVVILNPVMPEVGLELCEMLSKDFRFLIRKKDQIFIETKLKITKFIGELVNFKIFPKSEALLCFKFLLMDFVHHQIEMACAFVETCGRMLYRSPESHRRFKIYIDEMMRKKSVKSLEPRYSGMIENAYDVVCPKEATPYKVSKKSPLVAYLQKTIFDDLRRENIDKAIRILRKVRWNNKNARKEGIECLSRPWELKYKQYSLFASLISGIAPYQPSVVAAIVDNILEDIVVGIETDGLTQNFRRISCVQLLGEFFNYRVVGSTVVFQALYTLLNYGLTWNNRGLKSVESPDNLFRVRLICQVLRACGGYFASGQKRTKLSCFLMYFLRYYYFKREHSIWEKVIFPYNVHETVEETMRLVRPGLCLPTTYEEAVSAVMLLEWNIAMKVKLNSCEKRPRKHKRLKVPAKSKNTSSRIKQSRVIESTDGKQESMVDMRSARDYVKIGSGEEQKDEPKGFSDHNEADDQVDDFDRLLQSMVAESSLGSRENVKSNAEIPIPLQIRGSQATAKGSSVERPKDDYVPFVLITKKGNKQQYKNVNVSAEDEFVKRMKCRELAEKEEKEKVKLRTLAISELQEKEERSKEMEKMESRHSSPCGSFPLKQASHPGFKYMVYNSNFRRNF